MERYYADKRVSFIYIKDMQAIQKDDDEVCVCYTTTSHKPAQIVNALNLQQALKTAKCKGRTTKAELLKIINQYIQ